MYTQVCREAGMITTKPGFLRNKEKKRVGERKRVIEEDGVYKET